MSSVEATVIITAACLPTLRPVFLHFTGRKSTSLGSSSNKASKRTRSYQLHSYGPDAKGSRANNNSKLFAGSKGNKKKGADPYDINTQVSNYDVENEGEADSMEDRILPPSYNGKPGTMTGMGGIRKTFDVEVNSDGRASQQGTSSFGHPAPTPGERGVTSQEWDRGARGVYSPRPYDGTAI